MKQWIALLFFLTLILPLSGFAAEKSTMKLRVVAVNPSKEKPQTVPIKIYLPKEIIPDDIINMGELKVGYDSSKSVYFAYSDSAELAPQETRVFEVTLEDVWRVPEEQIKKMRDETDLALKHLENTPHYETAKAIVDSVNSRLNAIVVKQDDQSISREEHIGAFRVNQLSLEQIRQDINVLEKMLQTSGGPPSIEFLKDTAFEEKKDLDRITAWKLILAIIGFLAVLGIGFYVRWFLAIKSKSAGAKSEYQPHAAISEKADGDATSSEAEEVNVEDLLKPNKDKREAG